MKWLSPEEVKTLTGYKQHQKQHEALNQMGIDHVLRPDGIPIVIADDLPRGKKKEVRFTING